MEILIRQQLGAQGGQQYQDTEREADQIRIGANVDNELQWLGHSIQSLHATLTRTHNALQLQCEPGCDITVNGESTRTATLTVGDTVTLDGNQLAVIETPPGFDCAIQVTLNRQVDPALFERAYRTDLASTWLSRRLAAWGLVLAVVTMCLAIPLFNAETKPDELGAEWVPSVRMWSSGPLHEAHQLILGDDCGACHRKLFERVPDSQCLTCHTIADHLPGLEGTKHFVSAESGIFHTLDSGTQRCATCHQEHNEPTHLTLSDSAQCTDCHATTNDTIKQAVTGFGAGEHPPFSVTLAVPQVIERPGGRQFDMSRKRMRLAIATESSHLKFPHDLHLNIDKVQNNTNNQALTCANCHARDDDEHFKPIRMETHCQQCHSLRFDPAQPDAELPHGSPTAVILAMEGHFLRKLVDEKLDAKARTRRPIPDRPAREPACVGSAFECAQFYTQRDAEQQFLSSGCNTCHEIYDNGGTDLHSRFQVLPVHLTTDFMPLSRFNHKAHEILPGRANQSTCETCHAPQQSSVSADLLLPNVELCQQCHADPERHGFVGVTCVSCHDFHKRSTISQPEVRGL